MGVESLGHEGHSGLQQAKCAGGVIARGASLEAKKKGTSLVMVTRARRITRVGEGERASGRKAPRPFLLAVELGPPCAPTFPRLWPRGFDHSRPLDRMELSFESTSGEQLSLADTAVALAAL